MMNNTIEEQKELYHYGILGQKWGIRNYQNEDGTLTEAGKARYSKLNPDKVNAEFYRKVKKERTKQSNWSNQWLWNNSIGENSKRATDEYIEKSNKLNSEFHSKNDSILTRNDLSEEEYDRIYDGYLKTEQLLSQNSISSLNISYLKDLNYSDSDIEFINSILLKSKRQSIY